MTGRADIAELDLHKLVRQQQTLEGELDAEQLLRLNELILEVKSPIRYMCQGLQDDYGKPIICAKISTELLVSCQRCAKPLALSIEVSPTFELVYHDEQAKQVQREHEAVVTHGLPVNMMALFEDELILAIPMAPKHDHCDIAALEN